MGMNPGMPQPQNGYPNNAPQFGQVPPGYNPSGTRPVYGQPAQNPNFGYNGSQQSYR